MFCYWLNKLRYCKTQRDGSYKKRKETKHLMIGGQLTDSLTAWSRFLLGKVIVPCLTNRLPKFYQTQRHTVFAVVSHMFLSWSVQSNDLHPVSWRSVLILSTPLCLGLPNCVFPFGFLEQNPCTTPCMLHTPHISFFDLSNIILWRVEIMILFIM